MERVRILGAREKERKRPMALGGVRGVLELFREILV